MIRLLHVQKEFPNSGLILKDVNSTINSGDVVAVIGPSGTGKSTLLRCINMLDKPTGGKIFLNDEEITKNGYDLKHLHKNLNMVFQSFNLFEHISVVENVMLPQIEVLKKTRQEAYNKAIDILKMVGLYQRANFYPSQLSGGQKQRVAIARTLAMNPKVILFDEPTSALDPSTIDEVKSVIRDVAKSGTTMMIVTHDMEFARQISNRVFYMDQGIIYEDGTPEQIFDNPQKELTKRFIKKIKTLETSITSKDFDFKDLISSISNYGVRNNMSPRLINSIQLVTEELLFELLLPLYTADFNINLVYEYNYKDDIANLLVMYSGDKQDVFCNNNLDNTSIKLIEHKISKKEYSFNKDEKLSNILNLSFES